MRTLLASSALLLAVACAPEAQEATDGDVFGTPVADTALELARTDTQTNGTLGLDDGSELRFSSTVQMDGSVNISVELNGMLLQANRSHRAMSMTGTTIGSDVPPLMTEADRAAVIRLASALEAEFYPSIAHVESKAEYDALRTMSPAEDKLFSMVEGIWAQWPSSLPLDYEEQNVDVDRGITERHYYADNAYYIGGSHDCWDCDWWQGDCTDYKRIGHEFDGCNHGNSGVTCSGTQFTQDAINHDQCVRTSKHGGHSLASAWCNDQLASAGDDELFAASAGYDWRGSSYYNNCPTSWKGTSDGCDVHCQFKDPDCPSS